MLLLLLFAFLSGVVTIFAPCIWPILPIILSSGVSGGEKRPVGIVAGLVMSFTFFTLALSYILKVIPIDPDTLRLLAVAVISLLGVTLVVPAFGKILEAYVSRLSSIGGGMFSKGTGFKGGFVTGFALGIVWSPCAGPILATVATLAATQTLNLSIVLVTVSFVLGVGVPLLVLAVLGRHILTKTRSLSKYTGRIQQVFGVVMILSAIAIYTGYDLKLQARFAEFCSANGITFLDRFQTNAAVTEALDGLREKNVNVGAFQGGKQAPQKPQKGTLENYGTAPDFTGIMNWLNIDQPLTMEGLRGKVVLVDFWTYSCINCIRTLPYLTSWYEKYKDQGLVIVGVHTPEFEFEKKTANVADALKRHGITYPVAQDNNYATWQAYNNRYWPAHYLIDAEGNVREYHFGEGGYVETEEAIQELLREAGQNVGDDVTVVVGEMPGRVQTPETYLGSARLERFASPERVTGAAQVFTAPESLKLNTFAYRGTWRVEGECAVAGTEAGLSLRFQGKKVFLVMAPETAGAQGTVTVWLDGQPIEASVAGKDVTNGAVTVDEDRLYELVNFGNTPEEHTLELRFESGVTVYAFTFS